MNPAAGFNFQGKSLEILSIARSVEEKEAPSAQPSGGLERVTRLELATSSLARRCSTTELHPHFTRQPSLQVKAGAGRNNVHPPSRRKTLIGAKMLNPKHLPVASQLKRIHL